MKTSIDFVTATLIAFAALNAQADITGISNGGSAGGVQTGASAPSGITREAAAQITTTARPSSGDYATAKQSLPMVGSLPLSAFDNNVPQAGGVIEASDGKAPTTKWKGKAKRLFNPSLFPSDAEVSNPLTQSESLIPQAVGTGGIQYTSSQVFPQDRDTNYPVSTTGKLWFTINGAWYICSGSMVKPGIVVTAGHCVHSGNGQVSGWYSNFTFVPAYRNGTAPFGSWSNWAFANTTGTWYSGGGGVPNDADYAVIVFNKNASGYRIGDYTGWLGWQYPSLIGKHNTIFGYPGNLDGGSINHEVTSNVNQGGGNTGVWGSDMLGGSSGGGVIFNLRHDYTGLTSGWEFNPNRLVSVVSYGYNGGTVMVQGGSQFDGRFSTLLNNTCTSFPWAC